MNPLVSISGPTRADMDGLVFQVKIVLYNSFDTVLLHASLGGPFAWHEPYLEPPLYRHPAKHGILLMQPTRKLSLRPLLYSEPRS